MTNNNNPLPDGEVLAAIDIGSNSIHLIISRVVQGSLQTVASHRERVQLAMGMDDDRQLDAAAMQRGVDCLQRMGAMLVDAKPDRLRAVATYAVREAANRDEFIAAAEPVLGCRIEVISGREEARLIFLGIAHSQTLDSNALVIDIGGGSTELAIGKHFSPSFCASTRMGCVSFSEHYFAEAYTSRSFELANRGALQALEKYSSGLRAHSWEQVYASSGSAKALAQASSYFGAEASEVGLPQLLSLRDEIIQRGSVEWLADIGIASNRIELVPGGLAILIACMQTLDIDRVQYKDVALREGVLYEMIERMRHPDIRLRSRQSLQLRYNVDAEHANRVSQTVVELVEKLPATWLACDAETLGILQEAAQLHELGLQISANSVQKHSAYIIENSDLPGYDQDSQRLLAALVRQSRKRIRQDDIPVLRRIPHEQYLRLLIVLRLALLLNITRWPVDLNPMSLRTDLNNNTLQLSARGVGLDEQVLLMADLEREAKYLHEHKVTLSVDT